MPIDALWCGHAATDIHDEPHDQVGEVEPTVESVGERTKVAIAVLSVPEGFVGTGHHRLEVAQHSVDPLELRKISGLAKAYDLDTVSAAGFGHRSKTCQAVAEHIGARRQVGTSPLGDRVAGESWHWRYLDVQWVLAALSETAATKGTS